MEGQAQPNIHYYHILYILQNHHSAQKIIKQVVSHIS